MDVVPEAPHAAKELEAAMQRFVVDLAEERPDPENQITSAYHRLLAALERAGFPRLPQEAPHEHLHRVLVQLGVSPDPMRRLTELYVFAEFGRSQIGAAHREAASDALQVSLEALWKRYPRLRPTVAEELAAQASP